MQECILVVEDEAKIANVLKEYLQQAGFAVLWLRRGDEVMNAVRLVGPVLILLDLMLPGMDGIAVCRELRRFSDIPIIMVTARAEEVDRLLGLELGGDDYVCKPFSPREVVARVKTVLRRLQHRDSGQRLAAGPFLLDENLRQATVAGRALNLTPSEFGLLTVFLGAPERVFSRGELLSRIQGYQFEGYDRTIDSHIKNLRRKIAERLPDREVIVTVYGVGYKLSV